MFEFSLPLISELSAKEIHENMVFFETAMKNKIRGNKTLNEQAKTNLLRAIDYFNSALNVVINTDQMDILKLELFQIQSLINKSKQLGLPLNLYVVGGSKFNSNPHRVDMLFNGKELQKLVDLDTLLKEQHQRHLKFMENPSNPEMSWTLDQVVSANSKIDLIVDQIKKSGMSPYEAITEIYRIATENFLYKDNRKMPLLSRSIVGILNSDYVVCVGYASFIKAAVDKLDMPGLECETFLSSLKPVGDGVSEINRQLGMPIFGTGHMQNLVKINDLKYNIKGKYVVDACADSKTEDFPQGKGYSQFMFPVQDLMEYRDLQFDQTLDPFDAIIKITDASTAKKNPEDIPIIMHNKKDSKPIPMGKLKKCLSVVYKSLYPKLSENDIKNLIERDLIYSKEFSKIYFTNNAKNSIAVEAYKEEAKECLGE